MISETVQLLVIIVAIVVAIITAEKVIYKSRLARFRKLFGFRPSGQVEFFPEEKNRIRWRLEDLANEYQELQREEREIIRIPPSTLIEDFEKELAIRGGTLQLIKKAKRRKLKEFRSALKLASKLGYSLEKEEFHL